MGKHNRTFWMDKRTYEKLSNLRHMEGLTMNELFEFLLDVYSKSDAPYDFTQEIIL